MSDQRLQWTCATCGYQVSTDILNPEAWSEDIPIADYAAGNLRQHIAFHWRASPTCTQRPIAQRGEMQTLTWNDDSDTYEPAEGDQGE